MAEPASAHRQLLAKLGMDAAKPIAATCDGRSWLSGGPTRKVVSPIDDAVLATVHDSTPEQYDQVAQAMAEAFVHWGMRLRELKQPLGKLVSLEMGKSLQEGLGEVQEMIDICDFAVGLSRQLYGKTMPSERPEHRMMEQWHPLGPCGVISAFNFPVAVYAWNAAIALVCGDPVLWKPSEKTPLTAIAVQRTILDAFAAAGQPPAAGLVLGAADPIGARMVADRRLPLISATGSCRMGYAVGEAVAKRLGRSILELGGNNAIIVAPSADLELAVRAILFGAVGTAGQRCTTTRRVFIHASIKEAFTHRLEAAYGHVRVGDPLDPKTHMGPLIDEAAVKSFAAAVVEAKRQGAHVLSGGASLPELGRCYVQPTLMDCPDDFPLAQEETFAPILYLFSYEDFEAAVARQNHVRQGLSSALFSNDVREMEHFLSYAGSDCGIANINIGTSGAEIGGAFGGEKETGGGREAGSDAWRQYMRRQTNTINRSADLPLAQGIEFEL
jgi:aldehyde dehydrogenase (NAD+)